MYHGIINVYKEAGYTSHDVVAKLRGICKQKKIGHTGTLDPDAIGVLPVCLGNGTRLCDMLTDRSKEYKAVLRLGITTDTQDFSGKILEEKPVLATTAQVKDAIMSFQGDSLQVPPMYSALKVNGKKLYELARAGKEVERVARPITVSSIAILEEAHPDYTFLINCSKGTYIRTICHDIGQKLGCGGVMVSLQRTRVGEFALTQAHKLDEIQKMADAGLLDSLVTPVDKMFENLTAFTVRESGFKALQNGNMLQPADCVFETRVSSNQEQVSAIIGEPTDGENFRVYNHNQIFYGIYEYKRERGVFCPVKLFLPDIK